MLYGKNVVLGVSGGIAAYKSCEIVSRLRKLGANVDVIMTRNAEEFVTPLTFETLSGNKVVCGMFEPREEHDVRHVSLAKKAGILVVAPATANVIAKFAQGIADDMLTTTWLATKGVRMIAPAMNTAMYDDKVTRANIKALEDAGTVVVDPTVGRLACGDTGRGKMAEPVDIVERIVDILTPKQDLADKTVLITAGGTEEYIDGVRVITNHSSGKMGCAIVRELKRRGAAVTLVAANMKVPAPDADKVIRVVSAKDMLGACMAEYGDCDCIVKAAAVGDYSPVQEYANKIKGDEITLRLKKNPDIAAALGKVKGGRKLVIFCAETQNLLESAANKLKAKGADMVVANDVSKPGIGFDSDKNAVTVMKNGGYKAEYSAASKDTIAKEVVDEIQSLWLQA